MENANFEFNRASGVNREQKMDQGGREHQDALRNAETADLRNHDADHQRHQAQRLAAEQERLTQQNDLNFNMPKPEDAPPPHYKTKQEIEAEARKNVRTAHETARDDLAARHKIAQEDHEREAAGYPPAKGNYEARKAAYLARVQRQRQSQEREQSHERNL